MVYQIQDVVSFLSSVAPPAYQESYDNSGLITGNPNMEVTGILCSLDATEEVVDDAISKGCNLIVAHHPIVFKGLKSFTGSNYVERTIIKAIKNDIAIFAIHTNLDHVAHGVNKKICDKIGLRETKILAPKKGILSKLSTFVPKDDVGKVTKALFTAGAGKIGEYRDCSFQSEGKGTFTPSANANPTKGSIEESHQEEEVKVEVLLPSHLESKVLKVLKSVHPYEEVAYYLHRLENAHQEVGAGMVGNLTSPLDEKSFLEMLKTNMELQVLKHTTLLHRPIQRVAVCGGAGIFLLDHAKREKADIFITSDIKYHEFFDAENQIVICDIGHYESEIFTKDLLLEILSQKFTNIALYFTKVVTNPITYL
ncbi:Nif3-like dinuclear metal center hexameric protein [Belliella kenyensis]|uniref:GTP cyclohydrolase 1 type 2 homolog n=1 Tax=Belliella kenyensis TaxID=1472724 RepID=A0ABV8EKQ4_9BACT|nr:Nif3-like dinuclear metal center hexameric protein [Belliella kenyensis]MCH7403017.1 Nif3-like dinuclear metal center hexameric protein [Belliella kenyensis]MDN3605053.1 Nif3-like dinuclear metal center hexameric protein [Belliella kenyensis]